MADLTVTWLGLALRSPLVVGASPIGRDLDGVARAVEAGAGAVILPSLFEEQLTHEQLAAHRYLDARLDGDAEAASVLPDSDVFSLDAEPYLRALERVRVRVPSDVPVLGSLNGVTPGGWTRYAKALEDAGASALELNLYDVATDPHEPANAVEARQLAVVRAVCEAARVPVSVKLSAFYSALPAFVRALEEAGAAGVAVFNRFYQPDVDLEALDVDRTLHLSTPAELPLRLHALAVLAPFARGSLACTGGVHSGLDAAKAVLCGAHTVQLASALLARGPAHLGVVLRELDAWLDGKGYASAREARAVLDRRSAPDAHAYERVNYARMLDGWTLR